MLSLPQIGRPDSREVISNKCAGEGQWWAARIGAPTLKICFKLRLRGALRFTGPVERTRQWRARRVLEERRESVSLPHDKTRLTASEIR